jgi:hypothetical protein
VLKEIIMKVVLSFAEIDAFSNLTAGIRQQLLAVMPQLKKTIGDKKSTMGELLEAQERVPELVSVDMIGGTVTLTVPEELMIESTEIVGIFYEELIEMIPLFVALARMLKKATRRYEASVEALGEKFKKLVKKPAAE